MDIPLWLSIIFVILCGVLGWILADIILDRRLPRIKIRIKRNKINK